MISIPPIILFTLFILPTQLHAHGLMTDPAQRGTLSGRNKFQPVTIDRSAPNDFKAHFPAGDKDVSPGAAARSQMRAVQFWTPFTPSERSFRWRAGVCGDQIGKPQDHMRGGIFYYGGQRVRTYEQGDVIQVEVNIIAHHNGFMELHVCDIAKCDGEISEACFKNGHCHHLRRAPNPSCDSGLDKRCAPIDPDYPHRWYLPCTRTRENVQEQMGGPKMTFQLPDNLACDHCVVHWFWTAANTCNPPGVIEFFEGEHGPKNWGQCRGQAGARGGYTKVQKDCGPESGRFPEEYYQCADVRILPRDGIDDSLPPPIVPSSTPTQTPSQTPSQTPLPSTSPSPEPSPTSTPAPSSSATPEPSPTSTPAPSSSAIPEPSPSGTPVPSSSATPETSPTSTPAPSSSAIPEPSPSGTPAPSSSATPETSPTNTLAPSLSPSPEPSSLSASAPSSSPTPAPFETYTPTPTASSSPQPSLHSGPRPVPNRGKSVFEGFSLVADGRVTRSLPNGSIADITGYRQVAIEAVTVKEVSEVRFYIDDELVWIDHVRPYFMFGNRGRSPRYWKTPIVNRFFTLRVETDGDVMESRFMLFKRHYLRK